jgi:hypothetical protein
LVNHTGFGSTGGILAAAPAVFVRVKYFDKPFSASACGWFISISTNVSIWALILLISQPCHQEAFPVGRTGPTSFQIFATDGEVDFLAHSTACIALM